MSGYGGRCLGRQVAGIAENLAALLTDKTTVILLAECVAGVRLNCGVRREHGQQAREPASKAWWGYWRGDVRRADIRRGDG